MMKETALHYCVPSTPQIYTTHLSSRQSWNTVFNIWVLFFVLHPPFKLGNRLLAHSPRSWECIVKSVCFYPFPSTSDYSLEGSLTCVLLSREVCVEEPDVSFPMEMAVAHHTALLGFPLSIYRESVFNFCTFLYFTDVPNIHLQSSSNGYFNC